MTIWAMGKIGERARFVEASRPEEILGYMEHGDQCAPVSVEDKERGGILLGSMSFRTFTDAELAALDAIVAVDAAPPIGTEGGNS